MHAQVTQLDIISFYWLYTLSVFFFVSGQPRTLQDLCRIKIRQCIGLQSLKFLEDLPIARVMKDYLKHKFDNVWRRATCTERFSRFPETLCKLFVFYFDSNLWEQVHSFWTSVLVQSESPYLQSNDCETGAADGQLHTSGLCTVRNSSPTTGELGEMQEFDTNQISFFFLFNR